MTATDRKNTNLAHIVDLTPDVEIELGARAAAHFLEQRRVGFALICRVLGEPGRRRAVPR